MAEENGTSTPLKRFVTDCKERFQKFKTHISLQTNLSEKEAHEAVETLFFRLLFLRFLEEKEWLTFQGKSHYLSSLCASGGIHSESVYSSRFRPLFSKGLSVEGNQESDVYGSVPYLNLNLFQETSLDILHWDIPDDLIQSLVGKNGLFYNYEFDIDEFGSCDAINPEIIATLFEEFVADRQEKGVFYTPKPVVRYMCAEGIKLILEERTDILPEQVMSLIDQDTLGTITIEKAQFLREELRSIKAIDPACGSGAYLIGLLQELVRIDRTLSSYLGDEDLSRFHLKCQLISESLFGIDIDSAAVHRTMCRLWLSLATDSSLPFTVLHEEFNLESGDSLLGLGPKYVQEVLAEEGGFDLVLANPPYVHHRHIDSNFKKELLQQYGHLECSPVGKTSDLYCYFFLRANDFLRPNGIQIFICSNSWLDGQFGTPLQNHLLRKTHIISLIDSKKKKQFGNAEVNTIISIIRKSKPADTNFILFESKFSEAIRSPDCRTSRTISQLQLMQSGLDQQGLYTGQRLSLYHRAPEIYLTLRDRIRPLSRELQQLARISRGSSTGANAFFYLNRKEIDSHGIEEEYLFDVLRRPVECQSIRTSFSNRQTRLFSCSRSKELLVGTNALSYILDGESKGLDFGPTCKSRKIWYDVNRSEPAPLLWMETMGSSHRVYTNDIAVQHSDKFYGIYPFDDSIDSLKLCIWLNSSPIILHKLLSSFNSLGLGALKSPVYEVKKIPVPDLDSLHFDQNALESFLQRPIHDVIKEMSMQDRRKLEEPIMKMLGFSQEEEDDMRLAIIALMSDRLDKASS